MKREADCPNGGQRMVILFSRVNVRETGQKKNIS